MPRRKKTAPESPAAEPQIVATVLKRSAIAHRLASRDARAEIEPAQSMSAPEAALASVLGHAARRLECVRQRRWWDLAFPTWWE